MPVKYTIQKVVLMYHFFPHLHVRNFLVYDLDDVVAPRVMGRLVLQPVNIFRGLCNVFKIALLLGWLSYLGP